MRTAPPFSPGPAAAAAVLCLAFAGCASTSSSNTSRTGMEQLLISDAIDRSLEKVDFTPMTGRAVYIETAHLDCVDKGYLISSVRHRALAAGARLADKKDSADAIVEVRSGGVGTDRVESYIGTPAVSVPGLTAIEIPEVKLWTKKKQTGTAKIGIVAYDAKSGAPLGDGGMTMARSDDSNSFILGVGPWQSGTVREGVARGLRSGRPVKPLSYNVALDQPVDPGVRFAGGEDSGGAVTAEGRSARE